MGRPQRGRRFQRPKKAETFDEDDPEAFKDQPVPDKGSAQFIKDKVDEFHDEKIADLLARGVQVDSEEEELDEEEEVMALDDSEDEDEEEEEEEEEEGTDMESDLEGKKEDDLPNELAWGSKKRIFYDSDYAAAAKGRTQEELEAEEREEEEEAKNIQKRLAENLSEEDYDLNQFQEFAVEEADEKKPVAKEEKIVKDLQQMSQKEKMKLLKKDSPELLELVQDFKAKLAELKDELQPLLAMVKDGKIPQGKGAKYLKMKEQLYLNYLTNISFYLVLKAKRIPAHNHPVIERLLTYRKFINELAAIDARLMPLFRRLLSGKKKEAAAGTPPPPPAVRKTAAAKKKEKEPVKAAPESEEDSELDEEAALRFYKQVEERMKLKRKTQSPVDAGPVEPEDDEEEEEDPDAKRGITYQMAKNKGLTPKRKKIDRNPRVKHREKFRRAKIRRKGQVREVRREETRYSGEMSGIRAGVKKSVKLK